MTEAQIKHMVDRFLMWKLPEHFSPDNGISFERIAGANGPHPFKREPSGTNLFDATQANTMVRYMLEGLPPEKASLEDLLRMTVPVGPGCVAPEGSPMSPEFRVSVQKVSDAGVHFIIHANNHDSETLDFIAQGDALLRLR